MKLRNKQTGEIGYTAVLQSKAIVVMDENAIQLGSYPSLAELNEEWEDAPEEPKEHWTIGHDGAIFKLSEWENQKDHEEIGSYFDSEEEAELAVRKLKAWKRLKDNGFKIKGWKFTPDMKQIQGNYVKIEAEIPQILINEKDIDLLFGGEE